MSPRTHVGRRLLPPIFLPNIGYNQWASRIIALTFLSRNVSNESAFFVQRAHPYRAFFRTHIRTNFRIFLWHGPRAPMALTVPSSLRLFLVLRLLLPLSLLRHQENRYIGSHNQRTVKVKIYTDSLLYE